MDKKDIYEHLARIYLDASSQKKKKTKAQPRLARNLAIGAAALVFALSGVVYFNYRSKPFSSETALVLLPEAAKINFNFDPAKKEVYFLNLNRLDLTRYNALAFSLKNTSLQSPVTLKVEFTNIYREKSAVYLRDIPRRWGDFRLGLSQFNKISDWSRMSGLSFIVEEWHVKDKKGVVYIDNVRVLK
jgi:hypothetical protein